MPTYKRTLIIDKSGSNIYQIFVDYEGNFNEEDELIETRFLLRKEAFGFLALERKRIMRLPKKDVIKEAPKSLSRLK